jgi:pimeloyl-ACP methyl ester carboxylesterase
MKTFGLAILLAALGSTAQAATGDKPVSIVLVHGAFVDGSGWKAVHDALADDGYEVLVVQNPTVTLEGDAEATRQTIARAKHPVVLVGHSYGGAVITQAGDDPKVKSLIYIAAYEPDVGESVYDLATRPHPGEEAAPLLPPKDGFLLVDPAKFPTSFAADVDPSATRFMNASQVPWGLGAVGFKLTKAGWKAKPVHHMLTLEDHMVPPSLQRFMAMRAKAKIVEIKSSHAVMLSHPKEVVALIESVAAEK